MEKVKKYIIDDKELMKEWDWEKNKDYDPANILCGSEKKVWWKCQKCNTSWMARICNRSHGTGCPKCADLKRIETKTKPQNGKSLYDVDSILSAEWNYEKNNKTPKDYYAYSNKKVWWKCNICGSEWESKICDRTKGQGCPSCANSIRMKSRNESYIKLKGSLEKNNPNLAEEWNYEKNTGLTPDQVLSHSNKKVWWRCKKGHEWQAIIQSRVKGAQCPYCVNKKAKIGENDFKTNYPNLAKEWNYEKNKEELPQNYLPHSNKKVWWKCKKGHEWQATINHRVNGLGCPYCSGRYVIEGKNDLATLFPDLLKEWDYDKNKIKPTEIMPGSKELIWWKCKKGHEWRARLNNRAYLGRNCPKCAKELSTSFPELAVYFYISKYFNDAVSGNREILNGLELDIYIPSQNVAIEYDGVYWHDNENAIEREKRKNLLCKNNNIKLIRIREAGLNGLEDCICISRKDTKESSLKIAIIELLKLLNINEADVNFRRDRMKIFSLVDKKDKENSLQVRYPNIAEEWNYEKNGNLKPSMVSAFSNIKVWWKCKNGHEWESYINNRLKTKGCPYCSERKVIARINDFETLFPELVEEWDYQKNETNKPEMFTKSSEYRAWWKCKECGHSWQTTIAHRVSGTNCPKCMRKKVDEKRHTPNKGESLADLFPKLAEEWDYKKNERTPYMYKPFSQKSVWWKCEKGHEWEAKIGNRTALNRGCPYCSGRKK